MLVYHEPINLAEEPRKVWQYLPGKRRVKLAPEVGFDTFNAAEAEINTYDEAYIFFGSMKRYDWKLVGKKEIYIPYNSYRAVYWSKMEDIKPKFLDPATGRYELHRLWVVEATLKPGMRHVYHKRRFYVDEDSWGALACENYDAHGNLHKVHIGFIPPTYDGGGSWKDSAVVFDLIGQNYVAPVWDPTQWMFHVPKRPLVFYSPDRMAGVGIR
jgi:hypothetical protein